MRIGIIGAGALGLYYGALLQRSGQDVHFLLRRDFPTISQQGLQVYSVNGDFHLPQVAGYQTSPEIGPVDLVLVGLKTFSNSQLIELVRPLLKENTCILTLQNGLGNEERLAAAFGAERVLGGVAFLCSNRGEPGTVHHLGEGKILLGEFSGGLSERSKELAAMFLAADVPCTTVSDLGRTRWEKLVWNIPFNGLSTLLNQDTTGLLAKAAIRELVIIIMQEVVAGANAQPRQEQIDGSVLIERMIFMTEQMDRYRPSMMIDRAEKRPLELEAIYSIPLRQAKAAGVSMPRVEMLHSLLAFGESGNR